MTAKVPTSKAKTAYGVLNTIAKLALDEPKRMRMGTYLDRFDKGNPDEPLCGIKQWPACGTVGCIAGWTTELRPQRSEKLLSIVDRAARVLGLNQEQATQLFHDGKLCTEQGQGTVKHARHVVAHIRAFQQKYRAQLLAKKV